MTWEWGVDVAVKGSKSIDQGYFHEYAKVQLQFQWSIAFFKVMVRVLPEMRGPAYRSYQGMSIFFFHPVIPTIQFHEWRNSKKNLIELPKSPKPSQGELVSSPRKESEGDAIKTADAPSETTKSDNSIDGGQIGNTNDHVTEEALDVIVKVLEAHLQPYTVGNVVLHLLKKQKAKLAQAAAHKEKPHYLGTQPAKILFCCLAYTLVMLWFKRLNLSHGDFSGAILEAITYLVCVEVLRVMPYFVLMYARQGQLDLVFEWRVLLCLIVATVYHTLVAGKSPWLTILKAGAIFLCTVFVDVYSEAVGLIMEIYGLGNSGTDQHSGLALAGD